MPCPYGTGTRSLCLLNSLRIFHCLVRNSDQLFFNPTPRFRVTIAAYAMANASPPMSRGGDHDRRGLGAASTAASGAASGESACEEIARGIATAREAQE